jgi:hypothetical protein
MSELIHKNDNRATIRWKLLTGASALAFAGYVSSMCAANADDNTSHPSIWLELDGQFAAQKNDLQIYNPLFLPASSFDGEEHIGLQKSPPNIWDKGGKISFQPGGSDWVLSASIRYGKSARDENLNQLTSHGYGSHYARIAYQNFRTDSSESHTVLDFEVGEDVGLGKLGSGGHSLISTGVRIAQFDSRNHVGIASQPTNCNAYCSYNKFYASFDEKRRFEGIGPSFSWGASALIAGNSSDGGISLDWGVNGAVLFGRQKMSEHHQTTENNWNYFHESNVYQNAPAPVSRSKNVTVPNLGGFAGVSWRYSDAKVSLGYRADMFFGAIDGGIDTAKKENRDFYGPYASISVGIGD